MNTVVAWLKKLYAIPTIYRLFWTGLQAGVGILAGMTFDSPQVGILVGLVVVILTSEIRNHLAAS